MSTSDAENVPPARSAREFIIQYLQGLNRPARTAEIRSALREAQIQIQPASLNWALTNLNRDRRIRRVQIGLYETTQKRRPREPASGPGPQYQKRDGKLFEVPHFPVENEIAGQTALHQRLKTDAAALAATLQRAINRYPELSQVAANYAAILADDVGRIDVTAVWSVGGALANFADAYREQNIERTMAEPLEPQLAAMLQNTIRQHGAFILGFAEGRDLVDRADQFSLDQNKLRDIRIWGFPVLDELAENAGLVEERTRIFHKSIRDALMETEWSSSRVAYSAYLIVRNCVRATIKLSVGNNLNAGALVGAVTGISVLAGDPNADFIRGVVPFLGRHASQLLALFNHSPEMRAYIEWAFALLKIDHAS